tara:strand:- start:2219 stop:3355 length:1137 start_codon:yes stop_codon:yes gene_type:complete
MFDDFEMDDDNGEANVADLAADEADIIQPPKLSSTLYSHEGIEKQLLSLYNTDRLPHGLIFSGARGIGKCTFAYRLARFLLKNRDEGGGLFGDDAPKQANSLEISREDNVFAQLASGANLDFKIIEPDLKPNSQQKRDVIDVAQIRSLSKFLKMKASHEGGWRVAVIDDADLMNRNAQNALLKVLEEPPKKTVIILVCHRLGAMLPTIRSRTQVFKFAPLEESIITEMIEKQNSAISSDDLDIILSMANGSLGRALNLAEPQAYEILSDLKDTLSPWPKLNWPAIHLLSERFASNKDDITAYIFKEYMLWLFAECIKTKVNRSFVGENWLKAMTANYDLKQLMTMQDELKQHFIRVEQGNLDHVHFYLGAFFLLPTGQ